jgi:hypothetical protein
MQTEVRGLIGSIFLLDLGIGVELKSIPIKLSYSDTVQANR